MWLKAGNFKMISAIKTGRFVYNNLTNHKNYR